VTTNDAEPHYDSSESEMLNTPAPGNRSRGWRAAIGRILRRGSVRAVLALFAIGALIGGAYVVGSPAGIAGTFSGVDSLAYAQVAPVASGAPAAVRMGVMQGAGTGSTLSTTPQGDGTNSNLAADQSLVDPAAPNQPTTLTTIEAAQIVKTGSLSLEVADIDQSTTLAKAAVAGLGGNVSQSNRSGSGDYLTASITFRVPSARWDDTLTALHKLGSKILSEETNSTDVTSQVVDLDARLDNLNRTEAALQAIMNKAVLMADVLAVQNQLTQTQGQIEQLTAQRDHLKSQAAMSTLTVTFQLPSQTVINQTAQGWTLSGQIDEAGAALVRIGQGLATIGVWFLVVVLPIGFAALFLLGFVALLRRVFRRGKRQGEVVGA
jgi:Ca-activated chloride channel family protein